MIRLTTGQISAFWDAIKYADFQSNQVPVVEQFDRGRDLLLRLLSDQCQAWVLCEGEEKSKQVCAIAITEVTLNLNKEKEVLLRAIYAFRPSQDDNLYKQSIEELKVFARNIDAKGIYTFSKSERQYYLIEKVCGLS